MWVTDGRDGKLYAYRLSDGARDAARDYVASSAGGNYSPMGIWSNGETTWIADHDGTLYAYKVSDGSRDAPKDYQLAATKRRGVRHLVQRQDHVGGGRHPRKNLRLPLLDPGAKLSTATVAATAATLYLSGHAGEWWYQRATPSGDTTCHSVASGTKTASLSALTANTSYTYKAYGKTGCNSADELATATFSTPSL